jgi:DNA polymerase III alpha subunit (gram-positive type)
MLENLNAIFVDTETGGLDPTKHSLLSFGALFIKNGVPVDEHEWFIAPDNGLYRVTADAMKINKIDLAEHQEKAKDRYTIMRQFIDVMFKSTVGYQRPFLAGHNIQFDKAFLKEQLLPDAVFEAMSHRMIDTCSIARVLVDAGLIPEEAHSSQGLIDFFKIEVKGQRHSALSDAWVAWDLYQAMVKLVARIDA